MAPKGDFRFTIRVDPSPAKLAALIGGLGKEFADWRPAWLRLVPKMAQGIARNIGGRGSPLGEAWPQANPRYALRKARHGGGRVDLVLTGKLVADATNPSSVLRMGAQSVTFGVRLPYARAVNFGFTNASGKSIRSRKFMGWNDQMQDDALQIMDDYAHELLEKASVRIRQLQEQKKAG